MGNKRLAKEMEEKRGERVGALSGSLARLKTD